MKRLLYLLWLGLSCVPTNAYAQDVYPELARALDTTTAVFTADNLRPFRRVGESLAVNGDAAKSAVTPNRDFSLMETRIQGPATVHFDWKVSSEPGFDFLIFLLTDVKRDEVVFRDSISGTTEWKTKEITIPKGEHFLTWAYVKDEFVAIGDDAGWVDNFSVYYSLSALSAVQSLLLDEDELELPPDISELFPQIEELSNRGPVVRLTSTEIGLLPVASIVEYNSQNARIDVFSNADKSLVISIFGDSQQNSPGAENWYWAMSNSGKKLTPGIYTTDTRYPDDDQTVAFEFSGLGRGCTKIDAEFTIYEIIYDSQDSPAKLVADFDLVCEDTLEEVQGSIRYDIEKPYPLPPTAELPDFGLLSPYIPTLRGKGPLFTIETMPAGISSPVSDRGRFKNYSPTNANISFRTLASGQVQISIKGERFAATGIHDDISISLTSASGVLSEGIYLNAVRFPSAQQNGFSFSSINSINPGCDSEPANFTIYQIERNNVDEISKFTADFGRPCSLPDRDLRASIRYDSSLPDDYFPPLQSVRTPLFPQISPLISPGSVFELRADPNVPDQEPIDIAVSNLVATFNYETLDNQRRVNISIQSSAGTPAFSFNLDFGKDKLNDNPNLNLPLTPGLYRSASNGFFSPITPLLEAEGSIRFCVPTWGLFNIHEIEFNGEDSLSKLTADFTQYCGSTDQTARGSIRYLAE